MSFRRRSSNVRVTITSGRPAESSLSTTLNSAFVRADGTEDDGCQRLTSLEISHSETELDDVVRSLAGESVSTMTNASERALGCCSFSRGVSVLVAELSGDRSSPSPHLLTMELQNVRAEFGPDKDGQGRPFVALTIGPFVT